MTSITTNNKGESIGLLSKGLTAPELGFRVKSSHKSSHVLSGFGVVQPNKHYTPVVSRNVLLTNALLLPNNVKAYNTLNLRRISPDIVNNVLKDIISDNIMSSQREKRCLQRLTGSLLIQEPAFNRLPFFPYMCAAASLAIPTSPIIAHELALHILNNITKDWREAAPQAPIEKVLKPLDLFFRIHEMNRIKRLETTGKKAMDRAPCAAWGEEFGTIDHRNAAQLVRDEKDSMSLRGAAAEMQHVPCAAVHSQTVPASNSEGKRAFLDDEEGDHFDIIGCMEDDYINQIEAEMQRVQVKQDRVACNDEPCGVDSKSSYFVSLWDFLQYSCGASCHDYFWLPLQTFLIYTFLPANVGHHDVRRSSRCKNINDESNRAKGREEYLQFLDGMMCDSQSCDSNDILLNSGSNEDFLRIVRMSQSKLYATAMALVLLKRRELLMCTCKEEVHSVMCSPLSMAPTEATPQHRSLASAFKQTGAAPHPTAPQGTYSCKNTFSDLRILTARLERSLSHFMSEQGKRHSDVPNTIDDPKPFPTNTTHYPIIQVGGGTSYPTSAYNSVLKLKGEDVNTYNATALEIRKAKLQKLEEIEMDENEMYRRLKNELLSFNSAGQVQDFYAQGENDFISRPSNTYSKDKAPTESNQPLLSADERIPKYTTKYNPINEPNTPTTFVRGTGAKLPITTPIIRGDNTREVGTNGITGLPGVMCCDMGRVGGSPTVVSPVAKVPEKIIEAASLMVMAATGRLVSAKSHQTISNNRDKNSTNCGAERQYKTGEKSSKVSVFPDYETISTPDSVASRQIQVSPLQESDDTADPLSTQPLSMAQV